MPPIDKKAPLTWEAYLALVEPLDKNKRSAAKPRGLGAVRGPTKPAVQGPPRVLVSFKPKPLAGESAGLSARAKIDLSKGLITPEARIDLHGMTQKQAHAALCSFLERAKAARQRLVLVITGKGKEGTAILRTNLPRWCEAPALAKDVLAVRPASVKHGGAGAFYILLKHKPKA